MILCLFNYESGLVSVICNPICVSWHPSPFSSGLRWYGYNGQLSMCANDQLSTQPHTAIALATQPPTAMALAAGWIVSTVRID